jgi:hypothetical protein
MIRLDLPANVRGSPRGRILWKEPKFGPGSRLGRVAQVIQSDNIWLEVRALPRYVADTAPVARGWIHVSNVQPVCVIRGSQDLAALPGEPSRVERIAPAESEGLSDIELRAFGRGTGHVIQVQRPFEGEFLFETGDERRPLAYIVDADDMTAGDLVAFGLDGPVIWKHRGRIGLDQVRAGGEIVLDEDFECLPLLRTLAVRGGRFLTLATRFAENARAQTVPPPFGSGRTCTMIRPSGEVVRLAPGEGLQLEGLTPRGLIRVRRSAGGEGTIDPSLAAECFRNRLCAG